MNELKPCPFCGGQVAYSRYPVSGEGRIKCPTCQIAVVFLKMEKSEEEVAQCWNNRRENMESILHELALIKSEYDHWTKKYKALEQAQIELHREILNLSRIRSNLNSALSAYMDEEEQLEDEFESIWALRKTENKEMPTICVITLGVQVGNEEDIFRGQRGEAEMKTKIPCSMLEDLSLNSLLASILSAALADYDVNDRES